MRYVITGATSFIGAHIIDKLIQKKENEIWTVVRPNSQNKKNIADNERVHIIELDMCDIEGLPNELPEQVDVFYHLAWDGTRAPYRDDADIQRKNYEDTLKAFEVCTKLGIKKFICSGSQAEYGVMNGMIDENYPSNPNTEYGKAKYRAYLELSELATKQGIDFIWTRIFSIYGTGDYPGTLIMSSIDKMKRNEPIDMTPCVQEWDYLYIDDAADVFVKFSEIQCSSGIYNVASGEHMQLKKYVEKIKEILNSSSELNFGAVPYPKTGMVSFIPDITKLKNALEWSAKIEFEEGINFILQDEKNRRNNREGLRMVL